MADDVTIFNDRSIRILDGVLYNYRVTALDARIHPSTAYMVRVDVYSDSGCVLQVYIPPGTPSGIQASVWRSLMRHMKEGTYDDGDLQGASH